MLGILTWIGKGQYEMNSDNYLQVKTEGDTDKVMKGKI